MPYPGRLHHDPRKDGLGSASADVLPSEQTAKLVRGEARWAGRALIGYLLLATIAAGKPDVLSQRAAGHVSVALILLVLQVLLVVVALVGHERRLRHLDSVRSSFRHDLEAHDRREAS